MNNNILYKIILENYITQKKFRCKIYNDTTILILKQIIASSFQSYNVEKIKLTIINKKTNGVINYTSDEDLIKNLFSVSDSKYIHITFIDYIQFTKYKQYTQLFDNFNVMYDKNNNKLLNEYIIKHKNGNYFTNEEFEFFYFEYTNLIKNKLKFVESVIDKIEKVTQLNDEQLNNIFVFYSPLKFIVN